MFAAYSGGGSASLQPYYAVTPFEGISAQVKNVKYALGATGYKYLPVLSAISKTRSGGKPGLGVKAYDLPADDSSRKLLAETVVARSDLLLEDFMNDEIPGHVFYLDIEGLITPTESAEYDFGVSVAGTARLFVDGELVVDNASRQTLGDTFFGAGTVEVRGTKHLEGGREHTVRIEYGSQPTSPLSKTGSSMLQRGGIRIGGVVKVDDEQEIRDAVKLAKEAEQVIIVAGLSVSLTSPHPRLSSPSPHTPKTHKTNQPKKKGRVGIRRLRPPKHGPPRRHQRPNNRHPRRKPQKHSHSPPIRHALRHNTLAPLGPRAPAILVRRQRNRQRHRRRALRRREPERQTAPQLPRARRG